MSKLIVNEIEKYDAGQLTITTGTNVSIGSDLTVGGTIAGTLSTAAQTNITSVGTLSSLAVSGDVSIADKIVHTGDTNTAIRFPAADTVTIETNGAERVRIDTSGNVGIGFSSTTSFDGTPRLIVANTSADSGIAILTDSANAGYLQFADGTSGAEEYRGFIKYDHSTNSMSFSTNSASRTSEAMRIDNSGNLVFPNGQGIDFSASAGGGATSSLLDDYEEGTFAVAISTNTGSVTMNTNFDTAFYTKIGGLVTVGAYVQILSVSSPTGYIAISLPFTPVTTPDTSGTPSGSVTVSNSVSKNAGDFVCGESAGALRIFIADLSTISSANANAQQLQAGTAITFSFTYKTF